LDKHHKQNKSKNSFKKNKGFGSKQQITGNFTTWMPITKKYRKNNF